jgi:hypothetical protein
MNNWNKDMLSRFIRQQAGLARNFQKKRSFTKQLNMSPKLIRRAQLVQIQLRIKHISTSFGKIVSTGIINSLSNLSPTKSVTGDIQVFIVKREV